MTTIQWADFYQKVPAAVSRRQGPGRRRHAPGPARDATPPASSSCRWTTSPTELELEESDFTPAVWKAGIYQDKRYGIPLDVHSLAMYYNSDHCAKAGMQAPPATEAGVRPGASRSCRVRRAARTRSGCPSQWPAHLIFLSLIWQNGGEPYAEDGADRDLRLRRGRAKR